MSHPRYPPLQPPATNRGRSALLALAVVLGLSACALPPQASPGSGPGAEALADKPRIAKAADLPRFAYPVAGPLEDMVRSAERFAPFSAALRRDTEAVLAGYDIADAGTRRDLIGLLAVLDYLDGRYEQALARAEQVRALQDKPADKLVSGLRLRAMARAAQTHAPGSAAFAQAVGQAIAAELQAMPYEVVANDIKGFKAGAELIGPALVMGRVREVLQPMADASGQLSSEFAPVLVNARLGLTAVLPLKSTLVQVYTAYLARHQVDKPDIWAAREWVLDAAAALTPVPLAVWDSGVDTALFPAQLHRTADGRPALLAFDKYGRPSDSELQVLPPEFRARLPQMVARTQGFSDLQSNIDSPQASAVKQLLSGLAPQDYKAVVEDLGLAGNHEHGTHVAGIALAGNPFARLVVGRIEFGHTLLPEPCPSLALARAEAANFQAMVDFFRQQRVRVVNMSWGGSVNAIESDLQQCGIGADAAQRKAMARELFEIGKTALTRAFASAPGILFVTAAGNDNSDASFAEDMPADIVLPNLVTVGAVDRAGDEAPFTSYGPTVKLHANGYQVESFLPGGARVALSGTSMASPQVANLAAKLLAVRPALTPEALIDLMVRTADRSADGRRVLINPKRARDMLLAAPG